MENVGVEYPARRVANSLCDPTKTPDAEIGIGMIWNSRSKMADLRICEDGCERHEREGGGKVR
jgi:hypothetical protein